MTLADEINALRKEKNAVILAHNYQIPAIQDLADFVGDSLELSIKASQTKADMIVFCGVDFMAETAKIINPAKKVVIPACDAFCPMAHMLAPEHILNAKKARPNAAVMLYVNSSAECKALADYCCTSANAVKVAQAIKSKTILFGPDENLCDYTAERVPDKKFYPIPAKGFCPTHNAINPLEIYELKEKHSRAKIIAHPECIKEVRDMADHIASTAGMIRVAREDQATEFIIATEKEMVYRLKKEIPGKTFYGVTNTCPTMKKITLEGLRNALRDEKFEITIPETTRKKALIPIKRMLELR